MENITTIRIRQGLNGFPFSACTDEGHFIGNADSIDEIREQWKRDIKAKRVQIVKELHLFPEGKTPEYVTYGYARVSTRGQATDGNSLDTQEKALRAAGAAVIFKDVYTGTSMNRPEFSRLMEIIKGGDTLIVTKLDRFARSLTQANELITSLLERRVKINVLNMGVIDNSPASKAIRGLFLTFAEFERDMIVERTQEGKAAARAKGIRVDGRPEKFAPEQIQHAMELLQSHSYTEVERMTGISRSTLTRAKRRKKAEEEILLRE